VFISVLVVGGFLDSLGAIYGDGAVIGARMVR